MLKLNCKPNTVLQMTMSEGTSSQLDILDVLQLPNINRMSKKVTLLGQTVVAHAKLSEIASSF